NFPFDIERVIGQGSMGAVLLARETNLDRKVAIKILRPDFLDRLSEEAAAEASRRFLQEARASAAFSHSGIVTIHRLGNVDGLSYIAMEWVEGDDLASVIQQHAPLEISEACEVAVQLLEALGAAHDHDVIHRDVKPGNVMVQSDGQIKLTDFGIAHVKDSELVKTQAGEILGTPVYASPEQLLERGVDARADLFSVGVIVYEMLTGQLPFDGSNLASVATKIVNEQPPRVSTKNATVPDELDAVIHRAMAKKPGRRFSSADEMRSFFEQWKVDGSETLQSPSWADEITGPADLGEADGGTAEDETPRPPTRLVDGSRPLEIAVNTVLDWPAQSLGESSTESLLEKLLETPLHADPFAGAARLGNSLFFIYQGLIFASVDLQQGSVGDHVYEQLPDATAATLYPVPDELDDRCIPHLASILYEPDRLHEQLDSSFTDIPQLVRRLRDDNFDGAVQLRDGSNIAYLFFQRGTDFLEVFSSGWQPDPTEHAWPSWIDDRSVTVHVERRQTNFPAVTYRRELESRSFRISPSSEGREVDQSTSGSTMGMRYQSWNLEPVEADRQTSPGRDSTIWRDLYQSDPLYQCLEWMLSVLPEHMEERKRFDGWKYLTHWIPQISRATLYHELPRPNSRETEFFDLVTEDEEGKVLHLGRQVSTLTPAQLEGFLSDVKTAKHARNDRGDIGAALLVADDYTDEFVDAYHSATTDIASWMASMSESITGYEGFVRTGMRRGFHLLPVLRTDDGFRPILDPEK
ncbi:MAG: serine/threonine-protein kinase, partial [Bradymonadaceae bacterium]